MREDSRDFEELTLAEMVGQFFRAPRSTWSALATVTAPGNAPAAPHPTRVKVGSTTRGRGRSQRRGISAMQQQEILRLGLYVAAFILALAGNLTLISGTMGPSNQHLPETPVLSGLPFFLVAAIIVIGTELLSQRQRKADGDAESQSTENAAESPQSTGLALAYPPVVTLILLVAGGALAAITYLFNGDNQFTLIGVVAWFASIILIALAFAEPGFNFSHWLGATRRRVFSWPRNSSGVFVAIVVMMIAGAFFRLQDIDTMLPEMTSDHVEKLMDAQRVARGEFDVFFRNNGGREPFQMYAIALLSNLPGVDINFINMKLVAVIESVLAIPIFFWMGRTIAGPENKRRATLIGLAVALLLTFSYWHVAVTRVALRIILTPLMTALLLTFLARAMRYNRRGDFVMAGLVLGFSLYTYQAARMLPVVVVAGVTLALIFQMRGWIQRRDMVFNLAVLVLVSFFVFMPMFRFSVEFSEDFWRRTSGRLLGDDLIEDVGEDGETFLRQTTIGERVEAFQFNLPILTQNIIDAMLMFNYRGDVAWLHNAPSWPAMNPYTGAFLILGSAGWLVLIVRRRDSVYMLIPVALFIMLLPSALSIALPIENPSHTRTSGAMPMAYTLAGFGLAAVTVTFMRLMASRQVQIIVGVVIFSIVGAVTYSSSAQRIFGPYQVMYISSWKPLSAGGQMLRGFAESDGSYGNAFMLAFAHWWDFRAIGIEAGLPPGDWPNGDIWIDRLPQAMADAYNRSTYTLDPTRDILIMLSPDDDEGLAQLRDWFPDGNMTTIETYPEEARVFTPPFRIYRIPALGDEGLREFFRSQDIGI